jgi:hypothetical protein
VIQPIGFPDNLLYLMLEARLEKRCIDSPWKRICQADYVQTLPNSSELWDNGPSTMNMLVFQQYSKAHPNNRIFLGGMSFSDMTTKTKYLAQWPYLYSEVAAEYLRWCAESQNYKMKASYQEVPQHHGPAMYFRGYTHGALAYVDIQACYFQLYRYIPLDARYVDGILSSGDIRLLDTRDFGTHKRVRNTLFGLFVGGKKTITQHGKMSFRQLPTQTTHAHIATCVYDTVKAVALDALKTFPNITAWLTDAAILPLNEVDKFQEWLRAQWALESDLKSFSYSGHAYSLYSHEIGTKVTLDIRKGSKPIPNPYLHPIQFPEVVNITQLKRTRERLRCNAN